MSAPSKCSLQLLLLAWAGVMLCVLAPTKALCTDCTCARNPVCTLGCNGDYLFTFEKCGPLTWAGCLRYQTSPARAACNVAFCDGSLAPNTAAAAALGGYYCNDVKAKTSFSVPQTTRYIEVYSHRSDFQGTDCGNKTVVGQCGCGGATAGQCPGFGGVSTFVFKATASFMGPNDSLQR